MVKRFLPKYSLFLILGVLLLALFLRLFRLQYSPPRLTHDEMSIGYNAFSLLKTDRDEWSQTWPLDFEAFGDHKLPAYIYAVLPFIAVFDLSMISIKLPSVIAGIIYVWLAYRLMSLITKNKTIGLISALVVSLSPWSIHLSRMALESNLGLAFFIGGLWLLLKAIKSKTKRTAIFAGIALALSLYSYVAFRLIIILLWMGVIVLIKKNKRNLKNIALSFTAFVIVLLPLFPSLVGGAGSARFSQVSIFTNPGMEAQILEQQNFCFLSRPKILPKICRLLFNRPSTLTISFLKNYAQFVFPSFLFINGDSLEYLNVPGFGEFAIILSIAYLLGLYWWSQKKELPYRLLLLAFFISPIPSALVGEPQVVRGSAVLFFVSLFIAYGCCQIWAKIKGRAVPQAFFIVIVALVLFDSARYLISYYYIYPGKYEAYFHSLPPQVNHFLKEQEANYQQIYLDDTFTDAHISLAFYQQLDPQWYQQVVVRPNPDEAGFSHPIQLGKYYFGDRILTSWICDPKDNNILYVTNYQDEKLFPASWIFKDFSGVHTQAQVYDIDNLKQELRENNKLRLICPNLSP